MTNVKLSRDYLTRSQKRLKAIAVLLAEEAFADVAQESQEAVELLLKGALRFVGVDPPRRHDAAPVLLRHLDRLPPSWRERADDIRNISERLFSERGHAFYGDEDDLRPPSAARALPGAGRGM